MRKSPFFRHRPVFHRLAVLSLLAGILCACGEVRGSDPLREITRYEVIRPDNAGTPPTIILCHGFTRSAAHMRGWGEAFARAGWVVYLVNLPYWADHSRNAASLARFAERVAAGGPDFPGNGSVVLAGFSMGGLVSLLASANADVAGWIGLDPVDAAGLGLVAADSLQAPGLMVLGQPSMWNRHGNAASWSERAGALETVSIPAATHFDFEWHAREVARNSEPGNEQRAEILRAVLDFLRGLRQSPDVSPGS